MIHEHAPHIWVPKFKNLEPNREIIVPGRMAGFYKMEAVDARGRRRVLADWFPNLITDNGLELFGTQSSQLAWCSVGTGNTAPVNSNTALQTWLASTSTFQASSNSAQPSAPYYGSTTNVYRFAAGVATGNLAEVGVGFNNNGTNLFSRALILDGSGNPTTITVLSSEALDVTYSLRQYVPTADVTGSVVISGTTYNYTLRASSATSTQWSLYFVGDSGGLQGVSSYNGTISATVVGSPSGSSGTGSLNNASYSAGSHQRDASFFMDLNQSNLSGGISAFGYSCGTSRGSMGVFQVGLTPSIPKDLSHTLTVVLRHTWSRGP